MDGGSSNVPADPRVLAAMMDDLGNHRLEELAKDDGGNSKHRSYRFTGPAQPQNRDPKSDRIARSYRNAIEQGLFEDDDAAGVSGLDTLDSGNAHRVHRPPPHKALKYDPAQPITHRNQTKKPNTKTVHQPLASQFVNTSLSSGYTVSPLGAIVPAGVEVKRWASGHATKGVQTSMSTNASGQRRDVSAQQTTPIPSLPGLAKPAQSAGSGHEREISSKQQYLREQLPKTISHGRGQSYQRQKNNSSPNGIASGLLPNVSIGSTSQSVQPQDHALKLTSDQRLNLPKAHPPSPKGTHAVITHDRNGHVHNTPTPKAPVTHLKMEVLVHQHVGAEHKHLRGIIAIYDSFEASTVIWELTVVGESVTKGDIRELLDAQQIGSMVLFRRCALSTGDASVRIVSLRLESVAEAKHLTDKINSLMRRYANSAEAIYAESFERLSPEVENRDERDGIESPSPPVLQSTVVVKADEDLWIGSGWSDVEQSPPCAATISQREANENNQGSNPKANGKGTETGILIDFNTPDPIDGSTWKPTSRGDELSGLRYEWPVAAGSFSMCHDSKNGSQMKEGIQALEQSKGKGKAPATSRPDYEQNFTPMTPDWTERGEMLHTEVVMEAIDVLQDIEDIESICAGKNLSEKSLYVLSDITPADYTVLMNTSSIMARVLVKYESLASAKKSAALQAGLVYLLQRDKFLDLPRDEQKKTLAVVYTNLSRESSRIIRSRKSMIALRLGKATCPEEIQELNNMVYRKNPKKDKEAVATIHGPLASLSQERSEFSVTSNGILASRWAVSGSGDAKSGAKTPCEHSQPHSPRSPHSFEGTNETRVADEKSTKDAKERTVVHKRSSTNNTTDSIAALTQQMQSLSVSVKCHL
ncbi:hypothetical protein F5Y19DRAFT_489037 [Xylariaceae sp. FL1651]|nr:hypothetical protein F5Y19DRAFT_489037 [Xylariaceae sp. FL1651]